MKRRHFLRLGAVGTGSFALTGVVPALGRIGARVRADAPVVDRLVLTNVVDNVYDIFAAGGSFDAAVVERAPLALGTGLPIRAEHGLAFHLESLRGDERRQVLLDFSLTEDVLLHNYRALGVDPAAADALVLSHGHVDHYGALPALARSHRKDRRRGLILYAGGPDTFCERVVITPSGERTDWGRLDRVALEEQGLRIELAEQPAVVAGHAFTSGRIPRRTDFEKVPRGARLVADAGDSACAASLHFAPSQLRVEDAAGDLLPDTFEGEIATAYHVKGRGLVVISSCSHAGIVNSVRHLQEASGVQKVHAIVGGFHLAPAPPEIVDRTVEAFREIDPDHVLPMHCTGLNTIFAIRQAMPQKLVLPSSGTRVIFGA